MPVRRLTGRLLVLVAVCSLVAPLAAPVPAASAGASVRTYEWDLLRALNGRRAARGLAPLQMQPAFAAQAEAWAHQMASGRCGAGRRICHDPDLRSETQRASATWLRVGENVGVGGTVAALDQAFWDSPAHRANVLGAYRYLGVGVVARDGLIWVTFRFEADQRPLPVIGDPGVRPSSISRMRAFVSAGHLDLLGRPATPSDLARWVDPLRYDEVARLGFLDAASRADASTARTITDLYRWVLGRHPDPAALATWRAKLRTSSVPAQLAVGLYASTEFFRRSGGTDRGFVVALYRHALGRDPSPGRLAWWVEQLDRGVPRSVAARDVHQSTESARRRVVAAYRELLGRPPHPTWLDRRATALARDGDDRVLRIALMACDEYFERAQIRNR